MLSKEFEKQIKEYDKLIGQVKKEIGKIIVGQENIVENLLTGLLADGHILVEGVPGIAKTLLIRALAKSIGCTFKRIQFTVDLLPTDITGITAYSKLRGFYIVKGPIFANFVLADEINRAPPKVQSALLESMGEKQTTIGKQTFKMMLPFFVFATKNPLEVSGTYPLPEAQIDRFLFKLLMIYPNMEEEQTILKQNINIKEFEEFDVRPVISPLKIIEMQNFVKKIHLSKEIEKYIIRIVDATRNPEKYDIKLGRYIEWGGSPRASICLFIASKAKAMIKGRSYVTPQDIKSIAFDAMRHRIILNYEGIAEKISTDNVIKEILSKIPVP